MTKRTIGIDFGTSSTVMYIKDIQVKNGQQGQPQPVLVNGSPIIPSVAFVINDDFSEERNFVFGFDAMHCQNEGKQYINFKLFLFSDITEEKEKAKILINNFFKWLYNNYAEQKPYYGSCDLEKTFVSYPVKWSDELKEFMISTAINAGFSNVSGKDEASAAIQCLLYSNLETLQRYGIMKKNQILKVMLLDMGAGTSDIVIGDFDTSKNKLNVFFSYPTSDDDIYYGGKEFDEKICDITCEYLATNGIFVNDTMRKLLISECKTWKEGTLSPSLAKNLPLKGDPAFIMVFLTSLAERKPFPHFDRQYFEDIFSDKIAQFTEIIETALASAIATTTRLTSKDEIDCIVLTGGHSQWYFVKDLLVGKNMHFQFKDIAFSKIKENPEKLLQIPRPSETVALGLLHSEEKIEVKDVSKYNVWIKFKVGKTERPPLLVVRKNEILPFTGNKITYAEDWEIEQMVTCKYDLDFKIFYEINIFISEEGDINNADVYNINYTSECSTPKDRMKYRNKKIGAVLKGLTYFDIMDKVTAYVTVQMEKDKCLIRFHTVSESHEDYESEKTIKLS